MLSRRRRRGQRHTVVEHLQFVAPTPSRRRRSSGGRSRDSLAVGGVVRQPVSELGLAEGRRLLPFLLITDFVVALLDLRV